MPVRRETGAGVRSWCRWAGSNYSWPATTGERPVVGPAATGRRADADGAESAEARRPSNLLRLVPAKEVETISPARRRWSPGPPENHPGGTHEHPVHPPPRPAPPGLSRRALLAGTAAGAVGLSLAACGKGKKADSKTVTVVTHDSFHVSDDLMKAFTSETGYTLKVATSGDAGALVNKLVLTKDAPLGDAVFGIDNTYATRALDQGVIDTSATVTLPKGAESYVVADTPGPRAHRCRRRLPQHRHRLLLRQGPQAPGHLRGPHQARVQGPARGHQPHELLARHGLAAGHHRPLRRRLLRRLLEAARRGRAGIAEDWTTAYETDFSGGGKGTYPIVVSYASSPSFTVSDDGASSSTSALLDTAFRQVEYAGVLKGAANPEGGKAFVTWMLSKAVQEDIPGQMYMYPVLSDAALPEALTKFGPLSKAPVKVDPKEITAHREEWLNTWTEAVGK